MQARTTVRTRILPFRWVAPWAGLCGALAVLLAGTGFDRTPLPGEFGLEGQDFTMSRPAGDPLLVTETAWRPVPLLYADFDLHLDLELSAGAELDLLLRQVEPRPLHRERLPFQGRFTALRLQTAGPAGPGFRTREEALFGPGGGIDLQPGARSTIWVQARGHLLRANVAGRWLPWTEAADDHGGLSLLVRGGNAAVHALHLQNLGQPGGPPLLVWGAIVGVVLAGLGWALGARDTLASAVLLPLGALVGRAVAFDDLLPLVTPTSLGVLLAAALAAPFLLFDWLPRRGGGARRVAGVAAALVGSVALLEGAVRCEDHHRPAADHPVLQLVFGPGAADGLAEALARRVRGPMEVHVPGGRDPRVFLLGGQLQWGMLDQPALHVELLLHSALRGEGRQAEVLSLPTADGYSLQQWLLFDLFFRAAYLPEVVVFGIGADEAAEVPGGGARQRLQQWAEYAAGALVLRPHESPRGILGRRLLPDAERSSAGDLRATLAQVRAGCTASGSRLVLAVQRELSRELRRVVDELGAAGVPVVEWSAGETQETRAGRLAAALAPLLP